MSLAGRIPSGGRRIDARSIINILWIGGLAFGAFIGAFLLLHRLGVQTNVAKPLMIVMLLIAVVVASWFGRTLTGGLFFFAGRMTGIAPQGLGGLTDWMTGTFLIMFLAASSIDQLLLAPALMLGILTHTICFAAAFQRSGVSTVPGFFAWRYRHQRVGLAALIPTATILLLLLVAELQVAISIVGYFVTFELQSIKWLVALIVVIPTLFGGWLALVIVNAILVMWLLICLMAPATLAGFFPDMLNAIVVSNADTEELATIKPSEIVSVFALVEGKNFIEVLMTLCVLCTGFAALPHAISRLSLSAHHVSVMESTGWSALASFLAFSAIPLSAGLIVVSSESAQVAQTLARHPVLYMLPLFAILLASLNAAAVTLFAFSGASVRAFRRSRNLDPGERSMFATRAVCILPITAFFVLPEAYMLAPGSAFVAAICLSSATLFLPLAFAIWVSRIPDWAQSASILVGFLIVATVLLQPFFMSLGIIDIELVAVGPVTATVIAIAATLVMLLLGRLWFLWRQDDWQDQRLNELRSLGRQG